MFAWNYQERLKADVERWRAGGLIDADKAAALLTEVQTNIKPRSFGSVLAVLGAVLVGSGIIAFVAANWQGMGSFTRLIFIIASLWLAFGLAWFFRSKELDGLSHSFLVIGIAAFGGAIMLVGQTFHLQGSNADAMLLWLVGAATVVLATRSTAAMVASLCLLVGWMCLDYSDFGKGAQVLGIDRFYWFPLVWIVFALLVYWIGSRLSAHLVAIALVVWMFLLPLTEGNASDSALAFVCAVAFTSVALCTASLVTKQYLRQFERPVIVYSFALLLVFGFMGEVRGLFSGIPEAKMDLSWGLAALVVALILSAALLAWMRPRFGSVLLRDQYVVPIGILAHLIFFAVLVADLGIGGFGRFLLSSAVMLFMAVWAIRFGWRIEYRALSGVGYVAFITLLFFTYNRLFGSLQFTAGIYAIAGFGLIGLSIWLIRKEKSAAQTGNEAEGQ